MTSRTFFLKYVSDLKYVPNMFSLFQDLIKVHFNFLRSIDVSMMSGGSTLAKVFLEFKER